ncbi:hypothetical protein AG1IA_08794 [Rhizoctonia solani AG-1 IA]|uniref:Uncharacterized protein n=1 Tax=Thanatephorus cucumeris (strain AG1-IA) TaxID=983506 RepID=L8WLF6_THACA|nr:hypothetical protein AG1IA_08794 [Rhizoctonia solani AG-1 IA]
MYSTLAQQGFRTSINVNKLVYRREGTVTGFRPLFRSHVIIVQPIYQLNCFTYFCAASVYESESGDWATHQCLGADLVVYVSKIASKRALKYFTDGLKPKGILITTASSELHLVPDLTRGSYRLYGFYPSHIARTSWVGRRTSSSNALHHVIARCHSGFVPAQLEIPSEPDWYTNI